MSDLCDDNRFELIEKYKMELIEATNIETAPDEMAVLDDILFRFWQMGWLEIIDRMPLVEESVKTLIRSVGGSVSAKALRNAGRFMQNAIDGEAPEFEIVQASSETPNNPDAISRRAAIDALDEQIEQGEFTVTGRKNVETIRNYINGVYKRLRELPSAERRGRWIRTGEDGYCSVCKCDMPMFRNDWEWEYTETPYCPNCGARIEAIE